MTLYKKLPNVLSAMSQFENASTVGMDNLTPPNTKKSKTSIWRRFKEFYDERNLLSEWGKVAFNLKAWQSTSARRMKLFYKKSVKTMWNVTAELLQGQYWEDFGIALDPFNDLHKMQHAKYYKWIRKREENAHHFLLTEYCCKFWSFTMKTNSVCRKKFFMSYLMN